MTDLCNSSLKRNTSIGQTFTQFLQPMHSLMSYLSTLTAISFQFALLWWASSAAGSGLFGKCQIQRLDLTRVEGIGVAGRKILFDFSLPFVPDGNFRYGHLIVRA